MARAYIEALKNNPETRLRLDFLHAYETLIPADRYKHGQAYFEVILPRVGRREVLNAVVTSNRFTALSIGWEPDLKDVPVTLISEGLVTNKVLKELELFQISSGQNRKASAEAICELLSGVSTITHLTLRELPLNSSGAQAVGKMLRINKSLIELHIIRADSLESDHVLTILESLQGNKSRLRVLDLTGCQGVQGNNVYTSIMDLLETSRWLENIIVTDTPLEREGKAEVIRAQLKRRTDRADLWQSPTATPKIARVFLCGAAHSGKTTFRNSLARLYNDTYPVKTVRPILDAVESLKLRKSSAPDFDEWDSRTRGIDIRVLKEDDKCTILSWDLAGQEEFHAFHDFMIPDLSRGSPSCFVLLCKPFVHSLSQERKEPTAIRNELSYWLKFISSNTLRSALKPKVLVVFTHCDKPYQDREAEIKNHVQVLQEEFKDYIDVSSHPHFINARDSRSRAIKQIGGDITETCRNILEAMPKVYKVCAEMRLVVMKWNKNYPNKPIMGKREFMLLMKDKVEELKVQQLPTEEELLHKLLNAIALTLHEAGQIIYFQTEDFVVLNLPWFCGQKVMGQIVQFRRFVIDQTFKDGFAQEVELEGLLQRSLFQQSFLQRFSQKHEGMIYEHLSHDTIKHIIQLMKKLGLCYVQEESEGEKKQSRVFVPTTLKDYGDARVSKGQRQLAWNKNFKKFDSPITYVGRRVQCEDIERTTFTPGFFPKLQVELHDYLLTVQSMTFYISNEKNLMRVQCGAMEILVELSGDDMKYLFIDILVKSTRSQTDILAFVDEHVISKIYELCYSPRGCQGVVLQKGVVRPECVETLFLCKYRIEQAVLVESLRKEWRAAVLEPKKVYPWKAIEKENTIILEAGDDLVENLLGEKDTKELLDRRVTELEKLQKRLSAQGAEVVAETESTEKPITTATIKPTVEDGETTAAVEPIVEDGEDFDNKMYFEEQFAKLQRGLGEIQKGQGKILEKLEEIIPALKDRIGELEKNLLKELHRKVGEVIGASDQLWRRPVPCNVYFVSKQDRLHRRLITKLSGITSLELHLLCEHPPCIHVVKNQEGVEAKDVSEYGRKIIPLIVGSVALFNMLIKVGAHVAAGIGNMIPDVAKGIALILETQDLSKYLPTYSCEESLQEDALTSEEKALRREIDAAEQWLIDFLKGKNIWKSFGLRRVRYKDAQEEVNNKEKKMKPQPIRWLCDEHYEEGFHDGILEALPVH